MRAYDGIKAGRGREVTLETPDFLEHARLLLSKSLPVQIRMSGASMRPAIEDGDIITIEPIEEHLIKPADIILYHSLRDTAVIHRVVRVDRSSAERVVITRGDAAAQNDVPVPFHRILGKVKRVERAGERIEISGSKRTFLSRFAGWFRRLWSGLE